MLQDGVDTVRDVIELAVADLYAHESEDAGGDEAVLEDEREEVGRRVAKQLLVL